MDHRPDPERQRRLLHALMRDPGEGVWQFQSPLWETNSVLSVAGGEVLLCDPAFFVAEIERIRDHTAQLGGGRARIVITHADFDHVCGIPWFPDAEVLAGGETATKIG